MANFGWDYPPGVTGNEYEIAGPDYEKETDELCPRRMDADSINLLSESNCEGFLIEQGYRGQRWVVCSKCNYQADLLPLKESRYDTEERV